MPNFFKSFFSGKSETPENEKQKNDQKRFDIFKYDGLRAQRMGRPDYAIKCFTEALAIEEEFETMGYLSQLYIQMGDTAKARELLEKMAVMEPHITNTFLTLANVCFIQEDYQAMEEAANKAIAIEEGNAVAHYLLGKARQGQDDDLMTIAHLTKAITLKDDFIEARLLRAEALLNLRQYNEMMEDIDAVLAQNPEEETAILLRGKVKEANRQAEEAEASDIETSVPRLHRRPLPPHRVPSEATGSRQAGSAPHTASTPTHPRRSIPEANWYSPPEYSALSR